MTDRTDPKRGDPELLHKIGNIETFAEVPSVDRPIPTAKAKRQPRAITAAQLQAKEFEPINYVIPGYVAEGLTILAGRPKLGKSLCCLDLGCAVASGGVAFGSVNCERGDVLYLALEDNQRRLKSRLGRVLRNGNWPSRLTFWTECERLDKGGLSAIEQWISDHPDARLIMIDVFARLRPGGRLEDARYDADYRALQGLHGLAHEHGIAIVVVHHTRKLDADDPLDTVSGTLGFTGAADTVLVLSRGRQGVTLYGRGRDIEEIETAVQFDKEFCRWTILGDASDVHRSDQRRQIIDALVEAGEPIGPSEIADATGMKKGNIRALLRKMVRAGEIAQPERGKYTTPDNVDNNGNFGD